MININKLYNRFNSTYNTSQLGFFRPVADFVGAAHEVSLWAFNKMGPDAYQNQQFKDLLTPFSETMNISVEHKPSFSIAEYPEDYVYFDSARMLREKVSGAIKGARDCRLLKEDKVLLPEELQEDFFVDEEVEYEDVPVRLVQANRWAAVTGHKTKGPNLSTGRIYAKQQKDGMVILPREVGVIVLDYFRLPKEPVFNYRVIDRSPDKIFEFVENGSQHLEWSEAMLPVFVYHLGKKYGLSIQNQLILQVRNVNEIFE